MNLIIKHFQIIIHSFDEPLGFFEHLSKDLGLEKINSVIPFGATFVSTNLNIKRVPIVNKCIGSCRLVFSGYERCVCVNCYIDFAKHNIDFKLIKLNNDFRTKLNVKQPSIIFSKTDKSLLEILEKHSDIDYQRADYEKKIYMALMMEQLLPRHALNIINIFSFIVERT